MLSAVDYGKEDFIDGSGHPRQTNLTHGLLRKGLLFRGAAAAAAGAVLGIITSMIVNVSLVEVSLNPFFAIYFGFLFFIIGGLIFYRIVSGQSPDPNERHQKQLFLFSGLVILSGFVCFFLGRPWFIHLPSLIKIPVYTLLGTSICFSLTFTLVDIVNLFIGVFQSSAAKPLVQSVTQIRLIVSMALLMGAIFGTMFGVMKVEEGSFHIRLALLREEHYCFPIGGLLGGLVSVVAQFGRIVWQTGFANEYIRLKTEVWDSVQQNEFDEDI